MGLVLSLGVIDIPYTQAANAWIAPYRKAHGKKAAAKKLASFGAVTTAQVATWLESKYGVMGQFYGLYEQRIGDDLVQSMSAHLQDLLSGAPPSPHLFTDTESQIKTWFVQFIDSKQMDGLGVKGVPTLASLEGVNHRMRHPYARRPPRPSFRDTGTYEAAMLAWIK